MKCIFKGDLHVHSNISDGANSPKEIVEEAYYKGLNLISITDHDTFHGSIIALKYVKAYNITILPGIELSTLEGDILLYCIKPIEHLPRNIDNLVKEAYANKCIIVPAHPFDDSRNSVGELIYNYKWHGVEVVNASSTKSSNDKALRAAKILGVPGYGNSDAHYAEDVGKVYNTIVFKAPICSIHTLIENMFKKTVKVHITIRT